MRTNPFHLLSRARLAFENPSWKEQLLEAFGGFCSTEGPTGLKKFHSVLSNGYPKLRRDYRKSSAAPQSQPAWLATVESLSKAAALAHIRSPYSKLKAYCDEQVPAAVLEVLLKLLGMDPLGSRTPLDLAREVAKARSHWRAAWLALGELCLAAGRLDDAIEAARQALRLRGDCPTAQRVLYRAYLRKSKDGPLPTPPETALHDLKGRFCSKPFETLATVRHGDKLAAFVCDCGGWLPYPAGDIGDTESIDAVWNSDAAVEIRRSILDGDFSYCSRMLCPLIVTNSLPKRADVADPAMRSYIERGTTVLDQAPRLVQLSHDATCNLGCPTCRTNIINHNASGQDELARIRDRMLLPLLRRVNGAVIITGWGDPFASKHYLAILQSLNRRDFPRLEVQLLTNGLLFTPKLWNTLPDLHPLLTNMRVSVDASTPETYALVRRPGRWSQLMPNLEFISQLRHTGRLRRFGICFVVQKLNFREMPDFVRLGKKLRADRVLFLKLWNLGAFQPAEMADADVASPAHPLHDEFLRILEDPVMRDPLVDMFNLGSRGSAPADLPPENVTLTAPVESATAS
ncbi:MAG TPA: radical SAM protein [Candidatus Acidoferrum sp.]|jgi:wyosine [tRNA(Phe)-imidazoG37] synthetase (radical SAM superfamily)|nr:radical SAM protein [Candidatus Acidoferrum sp.]